MTMPHCEGLHMQAAASDRRHGPSIQHQQQLQLGLEPGHLSLHAVASQARRDILAGHQRELNESRSRRVRCWQLAQQTSTEQQTGASTKAPAHAYDSSASCAPNVGAPASFAMQAVLR